MFYLIERFIMKLSDLSTIWGIGIEDIKSENRRYNIIKFSILIVDIIFMALITFILFKFNSDFVSYLLTMCGLSFIAFFLYSYLANPNKHRTYAFYFRYRDCELVEETFDIDASRLQSLAYCIGFKRLKPNKNMDYYEEAILNYCYDDYTNSAKFLKYLRKYSSDVGELTVYTITKGKKSYFIDFKDNISSLSNFSNEEED